MQSKELKDFLEETFPMEENVSKMAGQIKDIYKKIDGLTAALDEAFDERDEVYGSAIEKSFNELKEAKDEFESNVSRISRELKAKSKDISDIVLATQSQIEATDKEFKTSIKEAKKEIELHASKLSDKQEKIERETAKFIERRFLELKEGEKDIRKLIEGGKSEIDKKISDKISHLYNKATVGGGSMPRQISLNGTVTATRYADINLIGSGVTFSAANNDAAKRTDITVTATAAGLTKIALTGAVNGANQTFTAVGTLPTWLVIDGAWYEKTDSNGVVQWSSAGLVITTQITPVNAIWGF